MASKRRTFKLAMCVFVISLVLALARVLSSTDTLGFVDMEDRYNLHAIPHGDDAHSGSISTYYFPFGNSHQTIIYVSTNGYFSLGTAPPESSLNNFPFNSSSYSVVAPFAADLITRSAGSVQYFVKSENYPFASDQSRFIESVLGVAFQPYWMLVAEWYNVSWLYGTPQKTNRFQGILITDRETSYALFVYNCNDMDWSGNAVIGWQASTSYYRTHPLSATGNAKNIACLNTGSDYTTVLFKIGGASRCPSYKVGCFDGDCTLSARCDGSSGCSDDSDEMACSFATCKFPDFSCDNHKCVSDSSQCDALSGSRKTSTSDEDNSTGLAVGLSVGLTILILSVAIPTCVICGVMLYTRKRRRPVGSRPLLFTVGGSTNETASTISPQVTPPSNASTSHPSHFPSVSQYTAHPLPIEEPCAEESPASSEGDDLLLQP